MLPLCFFDSRSLDRDRELFSGDFTREVTLVPIANTTVKLTRPMIVPTSAKVGHCRNLFRKPDGLQKPSGFFFFKTPSSPSAIVN